MGRTRVRPKFFAVRATNFVRPFLLRPPLFERCDFDSSNEFKMYDLIFKHKRIVQVILALISLPFAFFGVDYYFRRSGGATGFFARTSTANARQQFDDAVEESLAVHATAQRCANLCCWRRKSVINSAAPASKSR